MKHLILILAVLISYNFSQAQSFKIIKIQGKKAIVEVDDVDQIEVNKTYSASAENAILSKIGKSTLKRDHGIGASFFYMNTSASSVSTNSMNLSGEYLWNMKKYEFGPVLSYSNTSSGGVDINTISVGGVGFYNFTENKIGTDKIISIYGTLAFGSTGGSISTSDTTLQLGPNYRWFLLSGDHCISLSALYMTGQRSSGGTNSSTSGFMLAGGIVTYF